MRTTGQVTVFVPKVAGLLPDGAAVVSAPTFGPGGTIIVDYEDSIAPFSERVSIAAIRHLDHGPSEKRRPIPADALEMVGIFQLPDKFHVHHYKLLERWLSVESKALILISQLRDMALEDQGPVVKWLEAVGLFRLAAQLLPEKRA